MLVRHDPVEVKAIQQLKIRRAEKEHVVLQTLCDPRRPRMLCVLGHLIVRFGRWLENINNNAGSGVSTSDKLPAAS
jgi:hypothetical protein